MRRGLCNAVSNAIYSFIGLHCINTGDVSFLLSISFMLLHQSQWVKWLLIINTDVVSTQHKVNYYLFIHIHLTQLIINQHGCMNMLGLRYRRGNKVTQTTEENRKRNVTQLAMNEQTNLWFIQNKSSSSFHLYFDPAYLLTTHVMFEASQNVLQM